MLCLALLCTMHIMYIVNTITIKIDCVQVLRRPGIMLSKGGMHMAAKKEITKDIRLHILVDKPFKKLVDNAAHESWMSVGQYMRECVELFKGACYDDAADLVMIGSEVGLEGLEKLREMAERRNISVSELCLALAKSKVSEGSAKGKAANQPDQIDLFGN